MSYTHAIPKQQDDILSAGHRRVPLPCNSLNFNASLSAIFGGRFDSVTARARKTEITDQKIRCIGRRLFRPFVGTQ